MLTDHQNKALIRALDIIRRGKRLLIKGSAGVGKTYITKELLSRLSINSVLCTAPTNKAVAVLNESIGRSHYQFSTTHSALKLKRRIDYETGEITFVENDPDPLFDTEILLVDEASMLSKELVEFIELFSRDCKVIFLGDSKQLNPVNEDNSYVFECGYPEVELTEIVRQKKDNPIIKLSNNLKILNTNKSDIKDNRGYVFTRNNQKVIDQLSSDIDTKYLAWTNKEIDMMNSKIRYKIYGNPSKIESGEVLVFNTSYKTNNTKYFTNQEIVVNKREIMTLGFNTPDTTKQEGKCVHFKCYIINENILVIHEDSESTYKKVVKYLLEKAKNNYKFNGNKPLEKIKWSDYYDFIEQFANLKYNYAITVHKSQGSTYKRVIINLKNIQINKRVKEKKRLLYTGITRASELVVLYKPTI